MIYIIYVWDPEKLEWCEIATSTDLKSAINFIEDLKKVNPDDNYRLKPILCV